MKEEIALIMEHQSGDIVLNERRKDRLCPSLSPVDFFS